MYITKTKMELTDDRLVCYLHFVDGSLPDVFVNPATEWKNPNAVLVDKEYKKPGQTSQPEWGINISRKNYPLLDLYKAELVLKNKGTISVSDVER